MFYSVYGSKYCKEPVDKLMYGMSLEEFLEFKNYVEIQSSFELAIHKDHEHDLKQTRNQDGRK